MSKRFKIVLAVRFSGYLIFLIGLISVVFMLGPVISAEASYNFDKIRRVQRTVPNVVTSATHDGGEEKTDDPGVSVSFGGVETQENSIIPVSTQYGIVIEKINANAEIIPGVNPGN